jgi:hypothetical protein
MSKSSTNNVAAPDAKSNFNDAKSIFFDTPLVANQFKALEQQVGKVEIVLDENFKGTGSFGFVNDDPKRPQITIGGNFAAKADIAEIAASIAFETLNGLQAATFKQLNAKARAGDMSLADYVVELERIEFENTKILDDLIAKAYKTNKKWGDYTPYDFKSFQQLLETQAKENHSGNYIKWWKDNAQANWEAKNKGISYWNGTSKKVFDEIPKECRGYFTGAPKGVDPVPLK